MVEFLSKFNAMTLGILCSVITGFMNACGALPIFLKKDFSKPLLDCLLGFAAGVMLAATSFSLIIPAITKGGGGIKGATITLIGIVAGSIFIDLIDRFFPDTNLYQGSNLNQRNLRKIWMFALAVTVHNFPEGLAVGVGFGGGDMSNGLGLAIAIGLQNMPEGLAVALPFLREGFPAWRAFLIALFSGLVEPVGGVAGALMMNLAKPILPLSLSFAAGAVLFVISHEIIPETQKEEGSKLTTHSLIIGFVLMMFLDNALG